MPTMRVSVPYFPGEAVIWANMRARKWGLWRDLPQSGPAIAMREPHSAHLDPGGPMGAEDGRCLMDGNEGER